MPSEVTARSDAQKARENALDGRRSTAPGKSDRGHILSLQRRAGNAAVSRLLGGEADARVTAQAPAVTVQRLAVRGSQMRSFIGGSGSRVSSYAKIVSTLEDYERRKPKGKQELDMLAKIDARCTDYLNDHRNPQDTQGQERRRIVVDLQDQVASERLAKSRSMAEGIYLEGYTGKAGEYEHRFKAATGGARRAAGDAINEYSDWMIEGRAKALKDAARGRMDLVKGKGLTTAEHAAIYTYSDADFNYINPAVANSPGWMEAAIANPDYSNFRWDKLERKTLREEGGLHAALAVQGLLKLDKVNEPVYRAMNFPSRNLAAKNADNAPKAGEICIEDLTPGGTYTFNALVSTSRDHEAPIKFGFARGNAKRPIVVNWVITNAGGRDIQALSAKPKEAEAMLLPGTKVKIKSVLQVTAAAKNESSFQRLRAAEKAGAWWQYYDYIRQKMEDGTVGNAAAVYMIVAEGPG